MVKKTKGKSTWLMSYADLFTLLLTAFLLSVVLINEMENSLFLTIDTLLSQGLKFLDGEPAETYTDINGNGKYDEDIEQFIDCDQKYELCFGDPGWNEEMGNGKYDPYYLDGKIDNKSKFLNVDIKTPISISSIELENLMTFSLSDSKDSLMLLSSTQISSGKEIFESKASRHLTHSW